MEKINIYIFCIDFKFLTTLPPIPLFFFIYKEWKIGTGASGQNLLDSPYIKISSHNSPITVIFKKNYICIKYKKKKLKYQINMI